MLNGGDSSLTLEGPCLVIGLTLEGPLFSHRSRQMSVCSGTEGGPSRSALKTLMFPLVLFVHLHAVVIKLRKRLSL